MTNRQWMVLIIMAAICGCALGWSLRQIRKERQIREEPRVHLRRMEYPAANDRDIQETPEGLVFHL